MADETEPNAAGTSEPAAASGWSDAARTSAGLLLGRLAIAVDDARIDAALQVALWRKACAALLAAYDALNRATPPPDPDQAAAHLLETMPEAALLAVLASNPDHEVELLNRACVPFDGARALRRLALPIRRQTITCDVDAINRALGALPGAIGPDDLREASADPAFLLQLILLSGTEVTTDGGASVAGTIFHVVRQGARPDAFAGAAAVLDELDRPEQAELYRLMQHSAEASAQALSGRPADWNLAAIDAGLAAADRALAGPLAQASLLAIYCHEHRIAVLAMLAVDPRQPPDRRAALLDRAIAAIRALRGVLREIGQSDGLLVSKQAQLLWSAAELTPASDRPQARTRTIAALGELLADAALSDESVPRLHTMASIVVLLATAYYETGQLAVAVNQADMARRLARDAHDLFVEQIGGLGNGDDPNVAVARSGYETLMAQADRAAMIARARLAENRGAFEEAAGIYVEAVALERGLRDRAKAAIVALYGDAVRPAALPDTVAAAEARAAHFSAMATMSRADAALMESNHQAAIGLYADAGKGLNGAAQLWEAARAGLPAGPQQNDASLQAELGRLRARYCDCKVALAEAERRVAAGQHLGAAEKFIEAGTVLKELVLRSQDVDDPRNQQIMLATRHYVEARGLFEIDLDAGADGNLGRARELIGEAARLFSTAGEARWATFIRAQGAECEARVLQSRADLSAEGQLRATLRARAAERQQQARGFLEIAGAVPGIAPHAEAIGAMVPPRPAMTLGDIPGRLRVRDPIARDESDPAELRAELDALEETIRKLDSLHERGLDTWKYAALVTDYKQRANVVKTRLGMADT